MIKSIDTFYNGNYFRSRLEARWAVFFDLLGVIYQYEPKGFVNDNGECYLPDFYLPETYLRDMTKGVYLEIKPDNFNNDNLDASGWFEYPLVLFKGAPFINHWDNTSDKYNSLDCEHGFQITPNWDNGMLFWICNTCLTSKIEFAENNYDYCPKCKDGKCDGRTLQDASVKASKKRFEHNQ